MGIKVGTAVWGICAACMLWVGAAQAGEPGLVGWWRFDESSGVMAADATGSGHDGTLRNGPRWASGVIGGALEFDGVDDYVDLPVGSIIAAAKSMTVMLWAKFDRESTGASQRIFDFGNSMTAYTSLTPRIWTDGQMKFALRPEGAPGEAAVYGPTTLPAGWHHIAAVVNSSDMTMTLYLDGSVIGEAFTDYLPSDIGTTRQNWLGRCQTPAAAPYKGLIDDLRIYRRALTIAEVQTIYAEGICANARTAGNPDNVLAEVDEYFQQIGDWRADAAIMAEHENEIPEKLLVAASAKQARRVPVAQVLKDLHELVDRFPRSPQASVALLQVVGLEQPTGLDYALASLEKTGDEEALISFYARLVKDSLARSDDASVEKYTTSFVRRYAASDRAGDVVARLLGNFAQGAERQRLYEIIERATAQDPNSALSCGIFRQRVATLSGDADKSQLAKVIESTRRRYPGTKLAACASAVLADIQYQQGHYVEALQVFKPDLLTGARSEAAIIGDVDSVLLLYGANTMRAQGIDRAKIYREIADRCQQSGRYAVAVHCCRQAAKARRLSLDEFAGSAPEGAEYCNTGPDHEIWFWKGLLAEDDGDPMTACVMFEHFLAVDDDSVLSARAFYAVSRIQAALGWYAEARETITKAKSIVPCLPVIQLEQELNRIQEQRLRG